MRVCVPDDTYPSMEAAVAHDLAHTRERGLHANEAMRTVRSLLVQNFNRIDDELPPVSFVLRKQFREALSIRQKKQKRSGGGGGGGGGRKEGSGGKSRSSKKKNRALNQSDWNDDERLLAFVANDLGL